MDFNKPGYPTVFDTKNDSEDERVVYIDNDTTRNEFDVRFPVKIAGIKLDVGLEAPLVPTTEFIMKLRGCNEEDAITIWFIFVNDLRRTTDLRKNISFFKAVDLVKFSRERPCHTISSERSYFMKFELMKLLLALCPTGLFKDEDETKKFISEETGKTGAGGNKNCTTCEIAQSGTGWGNGCFY